MQLPAATVEAVTKQEFSRSVAFMRMNDMQIMLQEAIAPFIGGPGGEFDYSAVSNYYSRGHIPFTGSRSTRKRYFSAMDLFATGVYVSVSRYGIDGQAASQVVQFAVDEWINRNSGYPPVGEEADALPARAYIAVLFEAGKVMCAAPRNPKELRILLESSSIILVNAGLILEMAIMAAQGLFERMRAIALEQLAGEEKPKQMVPGGLGRGLHIVRNPIRLVFVPPNQKWGPAIVFPMSPKMVAKIAAGFLHGMVHGAGVDNTQVPGEPGLYVSGDPPVLHAVGRLPDGLLIRWDIRLSRPGAVELLSSIQAELGGQEAEKQMFDAEFLSSMKITEEVT